MKPQKKNYLSTRAFRVVFLLELFSVLLLCVIWLLFSAMQLSVLLPVLFTCLFVLLQLYLYFGLVAPFYETERMLQLFSAEYTVEGVFDLRYPVSPEMDKAIARLGKFLNNSEFLSATKKQAQYLALQNQINPHFLYNTLEGIRGEALCAGLENVADMTEALSTFFRYTISNLEHLVTLEDELENIENYFFIQKYRFGDRLDLVVEMEEADKPELLCCQLPKLTLQPIVENAIIHGIECKVGKGRVRIKVEGTEKRLLITVSDDGVGMDSTSLAALNKKLGGGSLDYMADSHQRKGGIALPNVNNRIKLLFGEEYGLCIYSAESIGTDAVLTLPRLRAGAKDGSRV